MDRSIVIDALEFLGKDIRENIDKEPYLSMYDRARENNAWFLKENIKYALEQILIWLNKEDLSRFANQYSQHYKAKNLAIICAGNIPAVAFHDIVCSLLSGCIMQVKLSSCDKIVIPFLVERMLTKYDLPISFVDKVRNFDLIIATGSNNTSAYFDSYFKQYPKIIRKSRSSLAVITDEDDICGLENDVFMYFGLGCRNISLLFLPFGYDINKIKQQFNKYSYLIDFYKYKNNYDYRKALFLMNGIKCEDMGFCLLQNKEDLHCNISVVNYTYYQDYESVNAFISNHREELQCVVANNFEVKSNIDKIPFGKAQSPLLDDFADGVDTMLFLQENLQ